MVNIKHENGEISQVDITEDVGQSIINLVGPKADQYAIVFMGKKLQIGIKFSDVEFLDDTHIVRIVKQSVRENDDTTANKKRVKELIFSCTNMLRKIENSHDVGSHVKLLTYTGEKFNEIIKHEPILVEQYNSKSFDLIFDFRLLMFVLTEHDESLYQFPQVLLVFKKALEYALAKNPSDEPSNNFPVPSLPATSSQSIITPQMLASALASAAAGTSGNVRASTNIPSIIQQPSMSGNVFNTDESVALENYRQEFQEQLAHMKECGFTNERKNIEALRLSEGNLDLALQIVIDNIEDEERMDSS